MHLRGKLGLSLLLLTLPATARADDGFAIGVRSEPVGGGLAVDYRRGGLDVTSTWFVHTADDTSTTTEGEAVAETGYDASALGGSLGVFHVIGEHGIARLSLGARVAYARQRWSFDDGPATTMTSQALEIPLRLLLQVTDRVGVSVDLGIHAVRVESEASLTASDGEIIGTVTGDHREVGVFGSPIGTAGITYAF